MSSLGADERLHPTWGGEPNVIPNGKKKTFQKMGDFPASLVESFQENSCGNAQGIVVCTPTNVALWEIPI